MIEKITYLCTMIYMYKKGKVHASYFKRNPKKVDESLIPQNIEAEEAVLGAILVNPETLSKVSDSLLPASFYKPAHRYIYEAMLQLFNNNDNIDIVSVSDVLSYSDKLEKSRRQSIHK